jgi:hypothetical protein
VVLGCWSATQLVASVTVLAARPSAAVAPAQALVPDLAQAAGVTVSVKGADEGAPGARRPAARGRAPPRR